jgi:uncharacterized protein
VALDPRPGPDRLIYSSESLPQSLTVIGDVVLRLYAASSAPDTDWFGWAAWEDPDDRRVRLLARVTRSGEEATRRDGPWV